MAKSAVFGDIERFTVSRVSV